MTDIQHLPKPENLDRVESGVVQFGEDWPGVFIRGDNALSFAGALREALSHVPPGEWFLRAQLHGLEQSLQECSVGDTGWPPVPKPDAALRDFWVSRFHTIKRELIAGGMSPEEADDKAARDVVSELRGT